MSDILFCPCPACRAKLRFPSDLLDHTVSCPHCHQPFIADGIPPTSPTTFLLQLLFMLPVIAFILFVVSAMFGFNPWS